MRDVRRRRRETTNDQGTDSEPIDEQGGAESTLIRREEFEVIHTEVARLPERYRGPVVLCDLEGLTYQQAAERLRCPVGTIGVRLKRARQRLRERLTRRGVVPSVGVMAAVLGADTASALTSPTLINSTIQAAIEFAASTGPNSLISASVITLAEEFCGPWHCSSQIAGDARAGDRMTDIGWLGIDRRQPNLIPVAQVDSPPLVEASKSVTPAVAAAPSIEPPVTWHSLSAPPASAASADTR